MTNNNGDENENTPKTDGSESDQDISHETGSTKEDPTSGLNAHIEKLQNDMLYLKADFENYKKRMLKERSDVVKYGSENLIISFLDVLDNFDRAMAMEITPENLKSFSEGIQMISNEFKNVLGRFGVTEVKALGSPFDPTHHEAMGTEPTTEFKAGTVSKVFTKPYKLHDRLIRPGKVIIAQEPKKDADPA